MQCSKHHQELDANGVGSCSVPMWMNGVPAGFCDEPAYGPQEPGQRRYGTHEPSWGGKWFHGYCSGLACHKHGGPLAPNAESNDERERINDDKH